MIDLFDAVSTSMSAQAGTAAKEARLRSLRDLDAAPLKLRDAGALILDEATPDEAVREAVLARVARDALASAVERVTRLAEPENDTFFTELRKSPGRLRYVPALLRGLKLEAAPAGRALLDAVEHLRSVQGGGKPPGPPPTAFAPKGWVAQLRAADGRLDLPGYRLAVTGGLRRALRRRDVFPARSLRYADPRKGLLGLCRVGGRAPRGVPHPWRLALGRGGARPPVGAPRPGPGRETAERTPANPSVSHVPTPNGSDLSVEPLGQARGTAEPDGAPGGRGGAPGPRLDLPELVLEVHARTGFADRFTHASEGEARAADVATSVCAVLVAEATNTGFEPLMGQDVPALRRSQLSWVKQNFVRGLDADGRQRRAGGRVRARSSSPAHGAAARWPRPTACATPAPIRTIHAGPNPRYFGRERGVTSVTTSPPISTRGWARSRCRAPCATA